MNKFLKITGLFLLLLSCGGALATSFLNHDASMREVDGAPAACLPDAYGEAIQLQNAYVMEDSRRGSKSPHQWMIELAPGNEPLTLQPGECVVFKKPIRGYTEAGGLAQLEGGQTYIFVFERGDHRNRLESGKFVGAFCVTRLPDGRLAHLPYVEHPNGTTTYPPCAHRRIGGPPAPDGIAPPRIIAPWEREK